MMEEHGITEADIHEVLRARERRRFWAKFAGIARTAAIIFLTIAVLLMLSVMYSYRDLPEMLESQRQQFEECKGAPEGTPGCEEAVVSEKEVEEAKKNPTPAIAIPPENGKDGKDGKNASQQQVDTAVQTFLPSLLQQLLGVQIPNAVSAYCDRRNGCTPSPPKDGVDGETGPTGATGATGPTGAKGDKGDPGRGILSMGCESEGVDVVFTIVFSDGTSEQIVCSEPTPEPTPELPAE